MEKVGWDSRDHCRGVPTTLPEHKYLWCLCSTGEESLSMYSRDRDKVS